MNYINKIFLILAVVLFGYGFYSYYKIPVKEKSGAVSFLGQKEVAINIKNFSFNPPEIIIDRGTKVTWTNNEEGVGHSVKSDPHPEHNLFPQMNSENLETGATFSVVFEKEGEYPYHCDPHSAGMKGKIIVK